jgi:hypothetical protein
MWLGTLADTRVDSLWEVERIVTRKLFFGDDGAFLVSRVHE